MTLNLEALEVLFKDCTLGVSARRAYEHMTHGQVNPFNRSVASVHSAADAAALIDLVRVDSSGQFSLTGVTLADIDNGACEITLRKEECRLAKAIAAASSTCELMTDLQMAARQHAVRRASRNVPAPFLPSPEVGQAFGVPLLRSRLREYLATQLRTKASAEQWIGTITNLAGKGLREEEWQRSELSDFLIGQTEIDGKVVGEELVRAIDFSALRIAVIPSLTEARTQLRFEVVRSRPLAKTKVEARPQAGQQRHLRLFDRVMGYRIEEVEHATLWGGDRHWQSVTFDGRVLKNLATRRAVFESQEDAISRAQVHAREVLPKVLASERWVDWSWTGGEEYREWLITLPYFAATYLSSHFDVRNILAHVRCDIREGENGERILMLHEVQSDWMQDARREIQEIGEDGEYGVDAPFIREWPALALKLMLLHAAHTGADAVGWTTGAHQEKRYRGLGKEGLKELYDRTLPREANRMLKPFKLRCEVIEVYVPDNFQIRRSEGAYKVTNASGRVLGVAATFDEARSLLPDGAHERLHAVHGVRLSKESRTAILATGFFAWGS